MTPEYTDAGQLVAFTASIYPLADESAEAFASRMTELDRRLHDMFDVASCAMQFVTPRQVDVRVVLTHPA
jgi:hypothetical protein